MTTLTMSLDPSGQQELRRHWGWCVALGLALLALGTVALGASALATLVSVIFFGWLLLIGGLMQAVQAFRMRRWGGFSRHLLGGLLSVVVGLLLVGRPEAGALSLTLLMAAFFMVGGLFRIVTALALRFPSWGWAFLGGLVTLLLGVMIWTEWPVSGLWVIGTFVGIDMIFDGWSLVMLGTAARNLTA